MSQGTLSSRRMLRSHKHVAQRPLSSLWWTTWRSAAARWTPRTFSSCDTVMRRSGAALTSLRPSTAALCSVRTTFATTSIQVRQKGGRRLVHPSNVQQRVQTAEKRGQLYFRDSSLSKCPNVRPKRATSRAPGSCRATLHMHADISAVCTYWGRAAATEPPSGCLLVGESVGGLTGARRRRPFRRSAPIKPPQVFSTSANRMACADVRAGMALAVAAVVNVSQMCTEQSSRLHTSWCTPTITAAPSWTGATACIMHAAKYGRPI